MLQLQPDLKSDVHLQLLEDGGTSFALVKVPLVLRFQGAKTESDFMLKYMANNGSNAHVALVLLGISQLVMWSTEILNKRWTDYGDKRWNDYGKVWTFVYGPAMFLVVACTLCFAYRYHTNPRFSNMIWLIAALAIYLLDHIALFFRAEQSASDCNANQDCVSPSPPPLSCLKTNMCSLESDENPDALLPQ
jgi:hypothetical protein